MNKYIKKILYSLIEKILDKLNVIKVYKTKVGIKNFHMNKVASIGNPIIIERLYLDVNDLYLGPDYLKDNYTLLDYKIITSPHYEFLKFLDNDDNIKGCNYVKRLEKGILDWRRKVFVNKKTINDWKQKYKIRKKQIQGDLYESVIVYKYDDKYYIYDGKHRAAMCALLNKKVKCDVVDGNFITSFYPKYLYKLMNDKDYKKHLKFILKEKGN